jgi:superfamily I DNA and/or RNA helicase
MSRRLRLHPDVCAFTSELFYEGRLTSRPYLDRQVLDGPTPLRVQGCGSCRSHTKVTENPQIATTCCFSDLTN